ncbi:MAG: Holliday junction resolvase [Nanoarchaeota archaeon]|nr:Holliday junction resolvase [Nanoarchaeota archaeon]
MKHKIKGVNAERSLIHLFFANEWCAIRVAGSGSSRYPSPDIIASNSERKLAIECKTSKSNTLYVSKDNILQLKEFSKLFGAESWLAVRFDRTSWRFMKLEDMEEKGKNFSIKAKDAEKKGLRLKELIAFDRNL